MYPPEFLHFPSCFSYVSYNVIAVGKHILSLFVHGISIYILLHSANFLTFQAITYDQIKVQILLSYLLICLCTSRY